MNPLNRVETGRTLDHARPRTRPIDCTIAIPTRERLPQLERCLRSLAALTLGGASAEILVSVDGPDSGERAIAEELSREFGRWFAAGLRVITGEPGGPGKARNRAIERARGDTLLLLNDDVAADPGLITHHLRAHAERDPHSPAMVLGDSPWVVAEPDRLFDRLIRETSMVFFYDQMNRAGDASPPDRDWGFRHAWTLNLSVPTEVARAVGGFDESLPAAAFEDLEWAWRVQRAFRAPVLYRSEAVVHHEHRYEPAGYLEREHRLGRDAWALALANAACASEVFGRDVRTSDEVEYSRAFVERERATATRLERAFLGLADLPADAVDRAEVLRLIYGQHLLLKRWHWRRGLLEAAAADSAFGAVRSGPVHAA